MIFAIVKSLRAMQGAATWCIAVTHTYILCPDCARFFNYTFVPLTLLLSPKSLGMIRCGFIMKVS